LIVTVAGKGTSVEAVEAMLDRWRERGRSWESRDYYPAFLSLEGRRCLVVGAGRVGQGKIAGLLAAGADVRVVSKAATKAVRAWAEDGRIDLELRPYGTGDLEGCFLVIAATEDTALNEAVFTDAEAERIFCNVVDVPRLCSFILPSIHRDGDLAVAISTGGASPALARKMRLELGALYGHEQAVALRLLGALREEAKAAWPAPADRKVIFERMVYVPVPEPGGEARRLLDLVRDGDVEAIEAWVDRCISEGPEYASPEEHAAAIDHALAAAGVDLGSVDPSN
jgi:precorrin-2 dehydrogenase / sirohydrochlorin ferrochelatase